MEKTSGFEDSRLTPAAIRGLETEIVSDSRGGSLVTQELELGDGSVIEDSLNSARKPADIPYHKDEKLGFFRNLISHAPKWALFGVGTTQTLIGGIGVVAGAAVTGATLGAAAPIGGFLIGAGLVVVTVGVGDIGLGIAKVVRKNRFESQVSKVREQFKNSYQQSDPKTYGSIKNKLSILKEYYNSTKLKDSKMSLLEIQIEYDTKIKDDSKQRLLEKFSGITIKNRNVKELKAAFEGELLKESIRENQDLSEEIKNELLGEDRFMTKNEVKDLNNKYERAKLEHDISNSRLSGKEKEKINKLIAKGKKNSTIRKALEKMVNSKGE